MMYVAQVRWPRDGGLSVECMSCYEGGVVQCVLSAGALWLSVDGQ